MSQTGKAPTKVLIIVENLPVPNDRRVWLEACTLRDAGYKVAVISIKGKNATKTHEVLEGISVYRYPLIVGGSGTVSFIMEFAYCWIMTFLLSLVVLFRQGIDIVHACNPPETFWLIGTFYKLFGKKFIFDHHDLSPEMYESRFGKRGFAYRMLVLLEWITFRTANAVITTNETHRRVAIERGKYPADKIFIVRSGPDHARLCPGEPAPALKYGHPYMVSYLGVINPQDGVDLFVRAAAHLVHEQQRDDIQFVIMGTGDAEPSVRALSQELGLNGEMHFTGWVGMDTIREYLSTSDVCVDSIPKTSYSDACTMNKILEYMSAARPIVTFDLTETRISAQQAAVYAQPNDITDLADKIEDLLANEKARMRMGAYGRRRIEAELAWEHQRGNLLAAYEFVQQ
jgi:glycosyltransferase involved in cell wall biosynthesis